MASEESKSLFQKDLRLAQVELENRKSEISKLKFLSAKLQKQYDEMAGKVSECIYDCAYQPEEEGELGNIACDICRRCCLSLEPLRIKLIG